MELLKPSTPFPSVGYFGPEYFCDREVETKTLKNNIEGGLSTTLVAIRRIGKTGLIRHLQHQLKQEYICIYCDILPTENSNELLNALATSILKSIPEKTGIGAKIWNLVKSLRPVISFDTLSGEPNVSFNVQAKQSEHQIEALFAFLEKQEKRVLFAIDEFQQVLNYPEKNIEPWLRTLIQQLNNVVFIFSGSQPHIMNDMFANPSKPFFRSALFLHLGKIDFKTYRQFIVTKFANHKKKISEEVAGDILQWANLHTYYVQLLCNRVFVASGREINTETWQSEASKLLAEQQQVFLSYRDILTRQQWLLLKSIALEGEAYYPTSKDFVQKHKLGSPATVLRSLHSLETKSFIYKQFDDQKRSFHSVYDVLFQRWIQNLQL